SPVDAALDAFHHVEHRADDALVVAQQIGLRDRKPCRMERGDDAELAVDRMGRGQELSGWFSAQHVFAVRRDELICRVGLPALELAHFERRLESANALREVSLEPRDVEAVRLAHLLRTRKLLLAIVYRRCAHAQFPSNRDAYWRAAKA